MRSAPIDRLIRFVARLDFVAPLLSSSACARLSHHPLDLLLAEALDAVIV